MGPHITSVFNYALSHSQLSRSQRCRVITLIFKKGDRTLLKNWRPISLLTTHYKILTRALVTRLQNVLASVISPDQTACILGRTINDNVALRRDVINYANDRNHPAALVSIDQLKAFDHESHSFLFNTPPHFGFGPTFIKWIKLIYTQVSSSVKVNGWLTAYIPLKRGLRQGCALSMPLYVLTAEIMAIQIRSNPNIRGILPPNGREENKLSQYADEMLTPSTTPLKHWNFMNAPPVQKSMHLNVKDFGLDLFVTVHNNYYLLSGSMTAFPTPYWVRISGTLTAHEKTSTTALNPSDPPSLPGNTVN